MKDRLRRFLPGIVVLLLGYCAYWLVHREASTPAPQPRREVRAPAPTEPVEQPLPAAKSKERDHFADGTTIEIFGSCRDEEMILRFPTEASYGSFIEVLHGSEVRLIDRLDRLRAMRVGASATEMEVLSRIFDAESITIYKGLTHLPSAPASGGAKRGNALGFGAQVLQWLGVSGDNTRWGAGVKVAVLDSGVVPHPGLPRNFRSLDLLPDKPGPYDPHGTAVASLIVGTNPIARGLAPAADLFSVRVLDGRGNSDAYVVAAGILAAMDAGAEILNLSLGEQEDCPLLGDAIQMALDAGIIVVAASGNEGVQQAKYPAAYPGVIGVGAIDASGERMAFSNLGSGLGLTAPGYGVNAAGAEGGYVGISGTSASAPLVVAAIAATMSDGSGHRVSAAEAAKLVLANADDEGIPGPDSEYGSGVLNIARLMNRNVRGRYDAAITCMRLLPAAGRNLPQQIEITVQNRGTEILINSLLEIGSTAGSTKINATTIAPGASGSFTVPINATQAIGDISCSVTLGSGAIDLTPENNYRAGRFMGAF